jgi:hypothetical protein
MNNITNITPYIEAKKLSNLSTIDQGIVRSDKGLKLINECLEVLNKMIERIVERESD